MKVSNKVKISKAALEEACRRRGKTVKWLTEPEQLYRNYQSFWKTIKSGRIDYGDLVRIADILDVSIKYLQGDDKRMGSRRIDYMMEIHPREVAGAALQNRGLYPEDFSNKELLSLYQLIDACTVRFLNDFRNANILEADVIDWRDGKFLLLNLETRDLDLSKIQLMSSTEMINAINEQEKRRRGDGND